MKRCLKDVQDALTFAEGYQHLDALVIMRCNPSTLHRKSPWHAGHEMKVAHAYSERYDTSANHGRPVAGRS